MLLLSKTDTKIMRFGVRRVANFLVRNKEVYTVRDYLRAETTTVFIPEIDRFATRTFVGPVAGREDLVPYVEKSGFSTSLEWWATIRKLTKSNKLFLYHVSIKPIPIDKLEKLRMYLAVHHRKQLRDASEYLRETEEPFRFFVAEDYTYSGIIRGRHGEYVVQIDAIEDKFGCSCWGNRGGGHVCWHIVAMLLYLVSNRYLDENIALEILRKKHVVRRQVTILSFI